MKTKTKVQNCSVDGCTEPVHCRTWCMKHYKRWYVHGTTDLVLRPKKNADTKCSLSFCADKAEKKGLCNRHYIRKQRGRPMMRRSRREARNPQWVGMKRQITYNGVHARLRSKFGSASKHDCYECGNQAREWALYEEPEKTLWGPSAPGRRDLPYTMDLSCYRPLCASCHRRLDRYWRKSR